MSGTTGLAVLQEGALVFSNRLLLSLGESSGTWRWLDGAHARVRYESFDEMLTSEALALSPAGNATGRFDRSGRVIELRLERLPGGAVVAVVHDVSEQLRAQLHNQRGREALLHEERMQAMGILASGVAHDLNHALNVIGLRVATLRADPRLRPADQALERLSRVVSDAAAAVARLQDLARRRRDRPNDPLDLTAVLTGAVEMARAEISAGPVRIEAQVPPLPLVRGSAAELSHVFTNLILRASDAMPDGGTVRVEATRFGEEVRVTVGDRGAVTDEQLQHIFDPFYARGASDRSLSLAIAYGVMQRLGGKIAAANKGGTLFTLTFPLAAPRAAQELKKPQAPESVQSLHVLLIDDEPDNLEVLREVLEQDGHRVDTAARGRDALGLVKAGTSYDLILCDVGMPEMSGWEVAREIRVLSPHARIFMLTGWAAEIGEADPRRRIVAGVLAKPLDLRELTRVLRASAPGDGALSGLQ